MRSPQHIGRPAPSLINRSISRRSAFTNDAALPGIGFGGTPVRGR